MTLGNPISHAASLRTRTWPLTRRNTPTTRIYTWPCPPLCPPNPLASGLTSWTGDLTLHNIRNGEIFAIPGQRYVTPPPLSPSHTTSSYSDTYNHRHRDSALPPNTHTTDQPFVGTHPRPPLPAPRALHTLPLGVLFPNIGDSAGGRVVQEMCALGAASSSRGLVGGFAGRWG
jgi:hypothetical protein